MERIIMNYKIKIVLQILSAVILLNVCGLVHAEQMNAIVEENVFLNENGITKYELAYSVPYNQMMFFKNTVEGGGSIYTANLVVSLTLVLNGQEHLIESTEKVVNTRFEENTKKKDYYYTDKVSLDVKADGLNIRLTIADFAIGNEYNWEGTTKLFALTEDNFLSDLEFSDNVMPYKIGMPEKLGRGDTVYVVNPTHMFTEDYKVHLYYEYYGESNGGDFEEEITVTRNGQEEVLATFENHSDKMVNIRHFPMIIEAGQFEDGVANYDVKVKVTNKKTGKVSEKMEKIVIAKMIVNSIRFFQNIDDEIKLINYFADRKDTAKWENLTKEGKLKQIELFWRKFDKTFIDELKKRINTANLRFRNFQDGWKTDQGRIYIKFGEPDQQERGDTIKALNSGNTDSGDLDAYSDILITNRTYERWVYMQGGVNAVYLFIETNSNGVFKLMYGNNEKDTSENIERNWRKYFGDNFDEAELRY